MGCQLKESRLTFNGDTEIGATKLQIKLQIKY